MRIKLTTEVLALIREDREVRGHTITQIMETHKLSKGTAYKAIKTMDAGRVKKAAPTRVVVESVSPATRPALSKTDLGEASRQMIVARLMLNGIQVFRPMTEDTPVDLLVLAGNRVLKCQCKYIFPCKTGNHLMSLYSVRKGGRTQKAKKHLYSGDEVDFFLGYCFDNDTVYVIPHGDCGGRHSLVFWILRGPANGGQNYNAVIWKNAFHHLLPK